MSLNGRVADRAGLRKYTVLAVKGFIQNLQYSASHLLNSIASAIFGVLGVYFWLNVIPPQGFAGYSPETVVHYITFNQTVVWFTQFGIRVRNRIRDSVRSGNVATELIRPVDFYAYHIATEYGSLLYGLVFRGIPVGLMLARLGYYVPRHPATWGWALLALLLGGYIAAADMYMVGLSSFWTTEVRTAYWVVSSLSLGLGGATFPLEVLPDWLYEIARLSPFACLNYNPARIYLELSGPELVIPGFVWAIVVTLIARGLTGLARRKLEVQGG
ncbi:MAG TPA: ABC transporter permease [Firmicutes bacterium]|nr:ABC transporter permease [Candidatus Fermentithermobacillaceae bacterium]